MKTRFHGKQRIFKTYIIVSASGPEESPPLKNPPVLYRSRKTADLQFTTADCDWFFKYFQEDNYDAGIAESHYRLVNPSTNDLREAIVAAGEFLDCFKNEPEWDGGQITFVYAGHGLPESGAWVLKDDCVFGSELAEALASTLISIERRR